jgi:uncharacterized protein YecE (DUF72 family)
MTIRVGIGGWTYEPWRGPFYPAKLPHAKELAYAAERLTAIEVNGTYYRSQSEAVFRKWASETPDGFVLSLKGTRFATQRGKLAEAGPSVTRFFESGPTALGDKLGPVLWQFAPTRKFDPEDVEAFFGLLPREVDGRRIRHVVEARHESFVTPDFIGLARRCGVAIVLADSDEHPLIANLTADFAYLRLQRSQDVETGYDAEALDLWASRTRALASGHVPAELGRVADVAEPGGRDVFVFFIGGEKVRNPAAAQALIARLGRGS